MATATASLYSYERIAAAFGLPSAVQRENEDDSTAVGCIEPVSSASIKLAVSDLSQHIQNEQDRQQFVKSNDHDARGAHVNHQAPETTQAHEQ